MTRYLILMTAASLLAGFSAVGEAAAQNSKSPTTQAEAQRAAIKPQMPSTVDLKLAAPGLSAVHILAANGEATEIVSGAELYAELVMTGGPPSHYRISTMSGFPGEPWHVMPRSTALLYALPISAQVDGPKTLYVQLMNEAGQSEVVTAPFEYRTLRPDLDPAATQSSTNVYAGQSHTYTVTVQNEGEAAAAAVTADSFLPEGFDYVSSSASHGFTCQHQSTQNRLRCTGGTIGAGQAATISIVAQLASSAQAGHQLLFAVTTDPENQITESSETNNTAGAVATTVVAPLAQHVVTGADAMKFARDHGYEFRAADVLSSFTSPCKISVDRGEFDLTLPAKIPGLLISIDTKAGAGKCRFNFFAEKTLKGPWKLTNVAVSVEGDMTWITQPAVPTDNPHFVIEMTNHEGDAIAHGWIDSITLAAPQNHDDWRDAFRD